MTKKPGSKSSYSNVFERAFAGHMDSVLPLLQGIGSKEAATMAYRAAQEYDSSPEERKLIAEKLNEYSD